MEQWIKILENKIPKGNYHVNYTSGDTNFVIYLIDKEQEIMVEIEFIALFALHVLVRDSFIENIIRTADKDAIENNFDNIIYKIVNGRFYKKVDESCSHTLEFRGANHFVVIGSN